jgi:hypothetical protein
MPASLSDRVLDLGLNVLDAEPEKIVICSAEPTTYTEANSTFKLGEKVFAVGGAFGAPAAGTPNGRKVSSTAITDGAVQGTGTATKWGVVDSANTRLLADGDLAASQAVTSGNTFSLPSFDIRIPSQ